MLDLTSLLVGFVTGAVAVGAIVQMRAAAPDRRRVQNEVTSLWDLRATPRLVVEKLDGIAPPSGARILLPSGTAGIPEDVLTGCEVRTHPNVRENAALGDGRAFVFTTIPRPGAVAISTTDPGLLGRLEHDWKAMWAEAEPYAPTVALVQVPQHVGSVVEVRGVDAGLTEYRGRQVLRVESEGHALPVLVKGETGLTGQPVRVIGKVVKADGMTCIDAVKVLPLPRTRATARN